jgi:hypothetical protein
MTTETTQPRRGGRAGKTNRDLATAAKARREYIETYLLVQPGASLAQIATACGTGVSASTVLRDLIAMGISTDPIARAAEFGRRAGYAAGFTEGWDAAVAATGGA